MKRKLRYLIAGLLLIITIFLIGSIVLNYNIDAKYVFILDYLNLIEDSSFENFNRALIDCCNYIAGNASIFVSQSTDAIDGNFSLNLTSHNHCSCINMPVSNFSNESLYILSFYYKGDNPHFCNWVKGNERCLPNKYLNISSEWQQHNEVLKFTPLSTSFKIYLYADSRDRKTYTNLYDNLQVHKLIPIENTSEYKYNSEEEYIIKTKADNNINGNLISDIDAKTGEAYFIVKGKPNVTIKLPWSEVVILVIMMLIIVRLMFKRNDEKII